MCPLGSTTSGVACRLVRQVVTPVTTYPDEVLSKTGAQTRRCRSTPCRSCAWPACLDAPVAPRRVHKLQPRI